MKKEFPPPAPSFPEAFDWGGGCTAGVPPSAEPAGVLREKWGEEGRTSAAVRCRTEERRNGLIQ